MRSILRVFPNQFFANLALLGLITGLVTSKVVLSVATITILCNALINIRIAENFRTWFSDYTNKLLLALFLVYLISGFYSEDTGYWVDRCRMKLPFLALPLGFTTIKKLTPKDFNRWLALYFYVIIITSIVVFINYLVHFESLNHKLTMGQPIPAPLNDHIRFSLEMAFAIIVGGYLIVQKFFYLHKNEKYILWTGIIFLVIFIHVFAVRSGIAALYLSLIVIVFHWLITKKQYIKGGVIFILMIGLALAAFNYIPSLKNRISYFKYELDLIKKGELHPEHSDAQRLLSIEYGWQIAKNNLIGGVGAGDIKNEMTALYNSAGSGEIVKSKLPHNQYVYFFAATGITGLLIFLCSVFYPWFSNKRYRNILYTAFMIIMLFSFLAEHTLEIQLGTAFYLLFLLLIKKYIDDNEIKTPIITGNA